jgi:hypothetical protein
MALAAYLEQSFPEFEEVTNEEYALWKRHPCTVELQRSLVLWVLDEIATPIPPSTDKTVPIVHQREGAIAVVDQVLDFKPSRLKEDT